jgi:hypothetical protein
MLEGADDRRSCLSSASQTSCMSDPRHLHSISEQAVTGDIESDRAITHRAQKRILPRVARWRGLFNARKKKVERRRSPVAAGTVYCDVGEEG